MYLKDGFKAREIPNALRPRSRAHCNISHQRPSSIFRSNANITDRCECIFRVRTLVRWPSLELGTPSSGVHIINQ